ncbi:hypothetical protein XBJ1_1745 [Xenorhabdus bovienii SS-2004]|uniref:Uncharacterized protein n=1 Tax=Xenorhabdus bovienii (strain SS-2004) TaxID=406818 RepID=D3V2A6_XENBS|nr:hypothetical protein XBJ1_1745 [Xenorhabdus bovienii SS-2004]
MQLVSDFILITQGFILVLMRGQQIGRKEEEYAVHMLNTVRIPEYSPYISHRFQ